MSTPKAALADLQKGKTWPVYFLFGEEPFKIQEFIEKMRSLVLGEHAANTYSVEKLDGPTCTSGDVINSLQSIGLFGGGADARKIVIVRQAGLMKSADKNDELFTMLMAAKSGNELWGENVLVMVSDSLDGRKKFHQWLKKQGFSIEFKKAQDSELLTWVDYLAKKIGVTVDAEAAQALAVVSDGSLYRLKSEIEKAWLYTGAEANAKIKQEDVAQVASSAVTHEMVELVSAILEKKKTRALILCEKLITGPEDALGMVGFLVWALKSPKWRVDSREDLLHVLIDLDVKLKSTGMDQQALVERFIVHQCS